MFMFLQFFFCFFDEVFKFCIYIDLDYNLLIFSIDIDSFVKFDDFYDSDEFLEYYFLLFFFSFSRSWFRLSRCDKILEEEEENEGDVSFVFCYVFLVL